MKEEKKLRQKFKEEFDKPEIPFEQWAEERGIFAEPADKAECPVYEPVENAGGRGMGSRNKKILCICAPILAALVLLAVLLACLLPRPKAPFTPQLYGVNDTTNKEIELEEITQQSDIYMFDRSVVADSDFVSKDVLIEDETQVMAYFWKNCLLSVENGEGVDAFDLTYNIKMYEYYEFIGYSNYSELSSKTTAHNKSFEYKIAGEIQPTAYAKFSVGKYEYFIEVCGYQDITTLTESNFLNLLNKVFI